MAIAIPELTVTFPAAGHHCSSTAWWVTSQVQRPNHYTARSPVLPDKGTGRSFDGTYPNFWRGGHN